MTRDERIARANEIFNMVYGDESREAYSVLEDVRTDLIGWAEELELGSKLPPTDRLATELRKIADRLEGLDLDGAVR